MTGKCAWPFPARRCRREKVSKVECESRTVISEQEEPSGVGFQCLPRTSNLILSVCFRLRHSNLGFFFTKTRLQNGT
jgi:hypothetical protein